MPGYLPVGIPAATRARSKGRACVCCRVNSLIGATGGAWVGVVIYWWCDWSHKDTYSIFVFTETLSPCCESDIFACIILSYFVESIQLKWIRSNWKIIKVIKDHTRNRTQAQHLGKLFLKTLWTFGIITCCSLPSLAVKYKFGQREENLVGAEVIAKAPKHQADCETTGTSLGITESLWPNISYRRCSFSLKTTNVNVTVALKVNQGVTKFILWTMNDGTKFLTIHFVDVRKFHWISENFDLMLAQAKMSGVH